MRKQRKDTGEVLSVKDLMVGEHIVLTNSVDNSSTIFRKTSNDYEFEYQGGKSSCYTNNGTSYLTWAEFSKYAVSGTSSSSTMKIIVKPDLTFIGGDGTALRPYYPEPAGSITSTVGGSPTEKSSEDIEALVNSIISVSSMVENLNNTLSAQENTEAEEGSAKEFKPFDVKIKALNGASATRQSSIQLHAAVTGRALPEIEYKVVVGGQTVKDYEGFPSDGVITVTGLLSGQNSVQVIIRDTGGNTVSDVINVWKLN